MARFAYFADLPNGETLEWKDGREPIGTGRYGETRYREVAARVGMFISTYPAVSSGNVLCGHHPEFGRVAITRRVELKSNPSRHECNGACINASGRIMRCECACGGKNHGRGAFNCEAA